jgi:hypothetical protein
MAFLLGRWPVLRVQVIKGPVDSGAESRTFPRGLLLCSPFWVCHANSDGKPNMRNKIFMYIIFVACSFISVRRRHGVD